MKKLLLLILTTGLMAVLMAGCSQQGGRRRNRPPSDRPTGPLNSDIDLSSPGTGGVGVECRCEGTVMVRKADTKKAAIASANQLCQQNFNAPASNCRVITE